MTRAEALRHALAFALRNVHVGAKRLKLDEDTRWRLAGEAIDDLRKYGGWKELDEERRLGCRRRVSRATTARVEGKARLVCSLVDRAYKEWERYVRTSRTLSESKW